VINIRFANLDDVKAIATVHVTSWQETYRGMMPDSVLDTLSVERRANLWKHVIEESTGEQPVIAVAEHSNRIIGFANYGKEREDDLEYKGELAALYVLKQFHGQGIGRRLMQKSAEGLLNLGMSSMMLWVLKGNPAQKFYEHMGGVYLREKSFEMEGNTLMEIAYGWRNIHPLASGG